MIDNRALLKKIEQLALYSIDTSWKDDLFNMGVWRNFEPVYDELNIRKSNITVSFIVCAFTGICNMVHTHRDRIANKKEILINLGANPIEIEEGVWDNLIYNKSLIADSSDTESEDEMDHKYLKVVKWYLNWQRDSDFKNWLDSKEFISVNMSYATEPPSTTMEIASKAGLKVTINTPDNIISGTAVRKAQLLQRCLLIQKEVKQDGERLRNKYVDIDTIIDQEFSSTGVELELDPARLEDRLRIRINKQNI